MQFLKHKLLQVHFQGFCGSLKSLKFSWATKSLKWYKEVLIMISRGLKFGDGKKISELQNTF